jgi:UDP-N-acetylglucosamine--N-acetylmuramyl-(pentapeptide) pyrophosphoryl-undecaprenol N-acetylglucosamine transferase
LGWLIGFKTVFMKSTFRVIISGGGTGGHIFPAIAIADALKSRNPDMEILFVGALGRMEMEKVPAAGYKIEGLPVAGFQRRLTFKNVTFFFKLLSSMLKARRIIKSFQPQVAVGVGGYASGPVLRAAAAKGIPTVLQEQNSFPGVTNRILARKAHRICVAYHGMERFFSASKIVFTGNPVRERLLLAPDKVTSLTGLGLSVEKRTILVIGGSLGAGSINEGVLAGLKALGIRDDVQLLWQTGKNYFNEVQKEVVALGFSNVQVVPFIGQMELAYSAADLVVSRAGAGTISELAILGKAVILVPSPNVSEDHQTKNAMALVDEDAALLVRDKDSKEQLMTEALTLLDNEEKRAMLEKNIRRFSMPDSARQIAAEIEEIVKG